MERIAGLPGPETARSARPVSVAIGNFDGVHRGHREVLDAARRAAEARGADLGVVTFEPHPRAFFRPEEPPFRLTRAPLRDRRLEALGVERLFVLPFDRALASLSPESFVEDVLVRGLGVVHVAVGADFRFGARRAGDVGLLESMGERLGFGVSPVAPAGDGETFSSSRIRAALREGDPREAARLLGDWHRVEGAVLHGAERGRDLGFPTANQALDDVLRPRMGIYAVRVAVMDGQHAGAYDGVASLGVRPTFGDDFEANLETYLFDFAGDLYGATLSTALCAFLRPELKFDGVEPLIAQMKQDEAEARAILADLTPPWAPPQPQPAS